MIGRDLPVNPYAPGDQAIVTRFEVGDVCPSCGADMDERSDIAPCQACGADNTDEAGEDTAREEWSEYLEWQRGLME